MPFRFTSLKGTYVRVTGPALEDSSSGVKKEMTTETKEQQLTNAFSTIGKEHGYDNVSADYSAFREFKVKWRRSCGWAEFEVSDYMNDAPQSVLNGVAETIFSRISRQSRREYPKEMLEWLASDEFVKRKQPIYLARSRNLTRTAAGEHLDLGESYQRLIDMGLVTSTLCTLII